MQTGVLEGRNKKENKAMRASPRVRIKGYGWKRRAR
jgi:hypothetical protein